MSTKKQSVGKKGRKVGRNKNKPSSQRYLSEMRWIKNKACRIARYMKKFPNWKPTNLDSSVESAVKRLLA